MKISKSTAYAFMIGAAIMWATSGIFTILALQEGATWLEVTVFNVIFAALILTPLIAILDPKSLRLKKEDFVPFLAYAVVTGTFFLIAWFWCVERTGVTTAVILLYGYPSIVTVASIFTLGEKLDRQKMAALPLTFVGAVLVAGGANIEEGLTFDLLGVGLGAYAAASAAVYYLWGKKFLDKYSPNTVVLYLTLLTIPGLVIIANPFELVETSLSLDAWLYILAVGFFPSTLGFLFSLIALEHIEASRGSIVASIEPVAAAIMAVVILSEKLNEIRAIGVALVFIGVLMLRLTRNKKEKRPEEIALTR
ncbi:MAG: DMT family transporter [Thermoplasmata archaeon]